MLSSIDILHMHKRLRRIASSTSAEASDIQVLVDAIQASTETEELELAKLQSACAKANLLRAAGAVDAATQFRSVEVTSTEIESCETELAACEKELEGKLGAAHAALLSAANLADSEAPIPELKLKGLNTLALGQAAIACDDDDDDDDDATENWWYAPPVPPRAGSSGSAPSLSNPGSRVVLSAFSSRSPPMQGPHGSGRICRAAGARQGSA